jgi:hypothetical protein
MFILKNNMDGGEHSCLDADSDSKRNHPGLALPRTNTP